MKAALSLLIGFFVFCSLAVRAQQFSPTTGVPCVNCAPANYTKSGAPSISENYHFVGGDPNKIWYVDFAVLDPPPSTYSQGLPANGGKNTFVTLTSYEGVHGAQSDKLFLNVSGFDVNKVYQFEYSVLTSRVVTGPISSPFGESAKMEIVTVGQNPDVLVASQTTNFDASNREKWVTRVITFTPLSSTLQFRLSSKTSSPDVGYINFSIDKYPFGCQLQPDQVLLMGPTTKKTVFPNGDLDLSTIGTFSATPAGAELVWKSGPNSSDPTLTANEVKYAPITNKDPNNEKPYYAFYYAKDFNCYNVPVSQAAVKFQYEPTQVPLKKSKVEVSCASPKGSLVSALLYPSDDVGTVWFKTNDHTGPVVYNSSEVEAGEYYAFYYKGGYSLPANVVSTAYVKVENSVISGIPDLGPTMNINSLIFPPNGSKDFVVKMQNIKAENSNCSVFFKVSKLPGFTITYDLNAGQSNVNGGIANNNDAWTFSEDNNYITATSKSGIMANGSSYVGFKIARNANTPASSKQNLAITIPQPGGGGETNTSNNQTITTLITN